MKDAQSTLDEAVEAAYGITEGADALSFLLELNDGLSTLEEQGSSIVGPGLPPTIQNPDDFVTADCVSPHKLKPLITKKRD